jgi:hypothetical protein
MTKRSLRAKLRLGERESALIPKRRLLLPGSLLVAIGTELFAALVFVDFRFASFFQ